MKESKEEKEKKLKIGKEKNKARQEERKQDLAPGGEREGGVRA